MRRLNFCFLEKNVINIILGKRYMIKWLKRQLSCTIYIAMILESYRLVLILKLGITLADDKIF